MLLLGINGTVHGFHERVHVPIADRQHGRVTWAQSVQEPGNSSVPWTDAYMGMSLLSGSSLERKVCPELREK